MHRSVVLLVLSLCALCGRGTNAFHLQQPQSLALLRTKRLSAAPLRAEATRSPPKDDGVANPILTSPTTKEANLISWKKQWYPVLPTSFLEEQELDREPYKMKICGEDLVIWKTSATKNGEYSILQDTCPHRRALLSAGKVIPCKSKESAEGGVLACRYHGWQFDKDGICTSMPMIPLPGGGRGSKAFNVPSYHCQTKGGLLWVYMDPDDKNPVPLPDEVCKLFKEDDDVVISVVRNPISWQAMTENFFDPSHAPFTHEGKQYSPEESCANV